MGSNPCSGNAIKGIVKFPSPCVCTVPCAMSLSNDSGFGIQYHHQYGYWVDLNTLYFTVALLSGIPEYVITDPFILTLLPILDVSLV